MVIYGFFRITDFTIPLSTIVNPYAFTELIKYFFNMLTCKSAARVIQLFGRDLIPVVGCYLTIIIISVLSEKSASTPFFSRSLEMILSRSLERTIWNRQSYPVHVNKVSLV